MSDKDHLVVVKETGEGFWSPLHRFGSMKDAQHWLTRVADPGLYHIVALRYEDVTVAPPAPAPPRNEVVVGRQHITRPRHGDEAATPAQGDTGE